MARSGPDPNDLLRVTFAASKTTEIYSNFQTCKKQKKLEFVLRIRPSKFVVYFYLAGEHRWPGLHAKEKHVESGRSAASEGPLG